MNVASMTRAIISMEMGMGTGMTRVIIQMAASWGLGRMGCGSVGRISSKRDGEWLISTYHFPMNPFSPLYPVCIFFFFSRQRGFSFCRIFGYMRHKNFLTGLVSLVHDG